MPVPLPQSCAMTKLTKFRAIEEGDEVANVVGEAVLDAGLPDWPKPMRSVRRVRHWCHERKDVSRDEGRGGIAVEKKRDGASDRRFAVGDLEVENIDVGQGEVGEDGHFCP